MAKQKFKVVDDDIQNSIDVIPTSTDKSSTNINPKSLANLHPRTPSETKTPQRYMQINVWEYEDYLYRMAKLNGTQITKYVLGLIKADSEKPENKQIYEGLRQKKEFDKPVRESPNKNKV